MSRIITYSVFRVLSCMFHVLHCVCPCFVYTDGVIVQTVP